MIGLLPGSFSSRRRKSSRSFLAGDLAVAHRSVRSPQFQYQNTTLERRERKEKERVFSKLFSLLPQQQLAHFWPVPLGWTSGGLF